MASSRAIVMRKLNQMSTHEIAAPKRVPSPAKKLPPAQPTIAPITPTTATITRSMDAMVLMMAWSLLPGFKKIYILYYCRYGIIHIFKSILLKKRRLPLKESLPLPDALIILAVDFEICLRMSAYRADLGCLDAYDYVSAVPALPDLDFALLKHLCCLDVL